MRAIFLVVALLPTSLVMGVDSDWYVEVAARWMAIQEVHTGAGVPKLKMSEDSVGSMNDYSIRVIQVVDEVTALCELDIWGTPNDITFMMRGESTKKWADGDRLRWKGDAIYAYNGTESYTTVLGAKRTVHSVRRVDDNALEKAIAVVKAMVKSGALKAKHAFFVASERVSEAQAALAKIKSDQKKIGDYIDDMDTVALNESARHSNDAAKQKYDAAKARLASIGEIPSDVVSAYKKHVASQTKIIRELQLDRAKKRAAWRDLLELEKATSPR